MNSNSLRSISCALAISRAPAGSLHTAIAVAALLLTAPQVARATVTGLCPDGSIFIVARREDAPCAQPKFVPASDLPPLRPQYLPRPYLWYVDQEMRDEHNPYNLIDKAQAIRELRAGSTAVARPGAKPGEAAQVGSGTGVGSKAPTALGLVRGLSAVATPQASAPAAGPAVRLADSDLRDLTQLVALRQELAPASLVVNDARGFEQLTLRFAYSSSAQARLRSELAEASGRVIVFSVLSAQLAEFHPNFLLAQGGATFRPEPEDTRQSGFLLGRAGPLPQGELALGYLVIPERFDLAQPLRIWWNDREVEATLQPAAE